jgi:hypothetical protein
MATAPVSAMAFLATVNFIVLFSFLGSPFGGLQ